MKCKDCACYKDMWCTMVTDSPDPDMERDCAHFILAKRWIPVMERLPEKEGWYLVFAVTFSDVVFFATSEGWCRLNTRAGRMEPFPYRVTHWMPLPEPPEVSDH